MTVKDSIGIKDIHYMALWDKNDLQLIDKWQVKIRNGERKEELVTAFFKLLESKRNDHHPNPEPLDLAIDEKYVMTFKGLGKFCRLITKQDSITFQYVAVGTGAPADSPPMPFDDSLVSEEYHVSFVDNGFFDATGTSLRYAGTFGAESVTDFYNESLVRTHPNFGDTGNINMCIAYFYDQPISHTQGNTGFTVAGSIDFQVIADIPMVS